jgi:hypothetical protein
MEGEEGQVLSEGRKERVVASELHKGEDQYTDNARGNPSYSPVIVLPSL